MFFIMFSKIFNLSFSNLCNASGFLPSPIPSNFTLSPIFPFLRVEPKIRHFKYHKLPNITQSHGFKAQRLTFIPLKDLRFSRAALRGHTWFISTMFDKQEEEVQFQRFPSESSKGRLLCLKGNDQHDGSWNYYALAWPEALPRNSTLKNGLTFVSYNHYNYHNIWHGLSAMVPFVSWYIKNGCQAVPDRWILYHWGELRMSIGPWLRCLMEATFGENRVNIERVTEIGSGDHNLDSAVEDDSSPVCFEDSVVMRHNEGGMGKLRRLEAYNMLRCKARVYCNVINDEKIDKIGLTLFMRTLPRSFKNESVDFKIFEK